MPRPMEKDERIGLHQLIGARVRLLRTKRIGMTGEELADVFRMPSERLHKIEEGMQAAPMWLLVLLAEETGVPIGWFVGDRLTAVVVER